MTNRIGIALVVVLLTGALAFAGGDQEGGAAATDAAPEIDFSQFPEAYPAAPSRVPGSSYDYDDMSQSYDFEILTYGYIVQPVENNPITAYLNEEMNVDITFTDVPGPDLNQTISVRFASGDVPDFIHLTEKAAAVTLADQGQLLNTYPYLEYVPQLASYVTNTIARWTTYEGEWLGFPRYGTFPDNWGLFIRQDYLDAFGMDMPETTDDLYEYAVAIKEQDPDGNGVRDEWFMGTGGGGQSHFTMMEQLRSAFGHPVTNVVDGQINHPVLDGTDRAYLEWMSRLYNEDLLHPDWYTIEWEAFKSFTLTGQIGVVNYPGWNLISETYDAAGEDLNEARKWQGLPALNSPTGRGGKLMPGGAPGGLFVFPRELAEEEGKMLRIFHFLDKLIYPNDHYWAASQGGDESIYPGQSEVIFEEETGLNVYNLFRDTHPAYADPNLNPLWNWQTLGYTLIWQVYNDPVGEVGSKWNLFQVNQPRHTNYDLLVTLDNELVERLREFRRREEIAFVLGDRSFDEWDEYVDEWLARGGQEMLDIAAEQLGVASYTP